MDIMISIICFNNIYINIFDKIMKINIINLKY